MAKYKILKTERDEALERAVLAERNSQLETLEAERRAHALEVDGLRATLAYVEQVARSLEERGAVCHRIASDQWAAGNYRSGAIYADEAVYCDAHAAYIRGALGTRPHQSDNPCLFDSDHAGPCEGGGQ